MKGFIEIRNYVSVLLLAGLLAGCGGGGGSSIIDTGDGTGTGDVTDTGDGSDTDSPIVNVTYPDIVGQLGHAEQTNGDAYLDFYGDDDTGVIDRILGNIEGQQFEMIIDSDGTRNIISDGNKISYTINADDTMNYQFYINDELQFEERNIELTSAILARNQLEDHYSYRLTAAECATEKALISRFVLGFALHIAFVSDGDSIVTLDNLTELIILYFPNLGVAMDRYKQDCMATSPPVTEPPATAWVRPTVNFNFVLDIDNTDLNSIYDDVFFDSSCADSYNQSFYVEDDTFCQYTNDYLSYGSTSYDEGDYKTYTYYDNGRGTITQYGESATLSRDRTYSLTINIINQEGASEEEILSYIARIEVYHKGTGVVFIEHYDENGSLTRACLPKENSSTEISCTNH